MAIRHFTVPATTNASGAATAYTPYFSGKIRSISYLKTDFADGVDFAITIAGTSEGVWSESNVNAATSRYPRAPTHSTDGAAALYAAAGEAVLDRIAVSRDRVKIVIAQGGDTKSGSFVVVVD